MPRASWFVEVHDLQHHEDWPSSKPQCGVELHSCLRGRGLGEMAAQAAALPVKGIGATLQISQIVAG